MDQSSFEYHLNNNNNNNNNNHLDYDNHDDGDDTSFWKKHDHPMDWNKCRYNNTTKTTRYQRQTRSSSSSISGMIWRWLPLNMVMPGRFIPIPLRRLLVKTIRFLFLVILMVTVIINILFIIETRNRLQQQQQSSMSNDKDNHFGHNDLDNPKMITVETVSSQNRAMVTVDGIIILDDSDENKNRGIHILVLNQMTGSVMARRHFDTYSTHEDEAMCLFISMVSDGRILIFAIKDEGTFQLKKTARDFLSRLGSKHAQDLGWRDMWTMVVQKHLLQKTNIDPLLGESLSKSNDFKNWASPAILNVEIALSSELYENDECQWTMTSPSTLFGQLFGNLLAKTVAQDSASAISLVEKDHHIAAAAAAITNAAQQSSNFVFLPDDAETKKRRRHFCSRIEGYGSVCSCNDPLPLRFVSNYDPSAKISQVPIAIIASNRPHYLYRMLRTLLLTPGCNPSMITIFIDGYYEEPLEVAKLFDLRGIQHTPIGQGNSRITQHYKASLTATFNLYPDARYAIVLEEDLDVSPDFFQYFAQTMHLLDQDPSLFCISAWNDQAYEHTSSDTGLLYRVETMPGLGWMLTRNLYKNELEAKWPTPEKFWDWDMWMRLPDIRQGRECIVPDVSRTFHFGSSGLNMNSYFQDMYFKKHAFNTNPSAVLRNVDLLKRENYERLLNRLIRMAVIVDHKKSPCETNFLKESHTHSQNHHQQQQQQYHNHSSPSSSSSSSSSSSLLSSSAEADPASAAAETAKKTTTTSNVYLIFIRMIHDHDFNTWLQMAKCLHVWDLDARGYHRGLWRLHYNGEQILVIGVPYSPYSVFKPPHIVPLVMLSTNSNQ